MWIRVAIGLIAIAVLAFGLCCRSKELDWRPIFVVLVGNFSILSTAFLFETVWPARRIMLNRIASIFHESGQSQVSFLITFALLFSMSEVLFLWIAVTGFRLLKSPAVGD